MGFSLSSNRWKFSTSIVWSIRGCGLWGVEEGQSMKLNNSLRSVAVLIHSREAVSFPLLGLKVWPPGVWEGYLELTWVVYLPLVQLGAGWWDWGVPPMLLPSRVWEGYLELTWVVYLPLVQLGQAGGAGGFSLC